MTPYQQLLDSVVGGTKLAPITEKLGMTLVSWEEGAAVMEMDVDESFHNAMGTAHGGMFVDIADAAFGCAIASTLEAGEQFTTVDIQATYFRAVRTGRVRASAGVVRRGRRTAYLECEVHESDKLVAKLISTCMILPATA